jgi:hypothetical protein
MASRSSSPGSLPEGSKRTATFVHDGRVARLGRRLQTRGAFKSVSPPLTGGHTTTALRESRPGCSGDNREHSRRDVCDLFRECSSRNGTICFLVCSFGIASHSGTIREVAATRKGEKLSIGEKPILVVMAGGVRAVGKIGSRQALHLRLVCTPLKLNQSRRLHRI